MRVVGIRKWLGLETRADEPPAQPTPGAGVQPPARSAAFTTDTALALSAVYRSVSILATASSQLTIDVWRGVELLEPKPAVLRRPDIDLSFSAFVEATVTSLATSGNAYWKLDRNARGEVNNAVVLNPWECVYDPAKRELSWHGKTLKAGEFHHLQLLRVPGKSEGLGPIQACRAELMGVRDIGSFASEWFTSGDVPSGVLKTDQVLSPDQAQQYQERWEQREGHRVAVLGNGLDYDPVLLSPKDAQFLESQQFSITQIARLFGIPAHLLLAAVEGGSQTYQNIAQADLSFVRWTLMKYLREIEEAFSAILPGIQTARFNLDGVLRPDTKSRYDAHRVGLDAGFLSVNEVRALEGLAPVSGGDVVRPAITSTPATQEPS